MPRGLVRYQQCGVFHFVTFSCYRRQPLLASGNAYRIFEEALEWTRLRSKLMIAGYVHRNPVKPGLVAKQEDWPW